MRKFVVIPLLLMACSLWGQKMSRETPAGEVYIGYSLLNGDTLSKASGWEGSLTGNVRDWLGLKVDLGGNYKSAGPIHAHEYNILFGPQASHHINRLNLFVHGLIGVAHFGDNAGHTSTGPGWVLGGGAEYELDPRLAVRLAQLDYHGGHVFGTTQKDFRYSLGLVFRFK